MMIWSKVPAVIAACFFMLSCSARPGLEHYDRPMESGTVEVRRDGTAIIRGIHSDIAIRQIRDEEWEDILKFSSFKNEKIKEPQYRVPRLKFFMVSIKNTSERPLVLEKATLSYNDVTLANMDEKKITDESKSKIYQLFNFAEILKPRRLITAGETLGKIDLGSDTLLYEISFVPPSDRLFRIIAFPTIPVEIRSYRITFHLSYSGIRKEVSFDMNRFEYRTRGTHFIEPVQDDTEDP